MTAGVVVPFRQTQRKEIAVAKITTPDPVILTETESRFVDEYMVDRDSGAAAIRAGVARINVKKRVQGWMSDQKILREILKRTDGTPLESMITPQRIMAGFIDVAFDRTANHSARNSALKELASLNKMYGDDDDDNEGSGVVLIPIAGTMEDWKALAMASQERLKTTVKE